MMARGLAGIPGIQIDPAKVQTNIVIFDVSGTGLAAAEISARLKERGVLIDPINATVMRLVTHYDVDREGCEMALAALAEVAAKVGSAAV
jgi:threonine aldolase